MTGDIMPLSPREHSILAAIEHDMAEDDPALVATLTTARVPSRHALVPMGYVAAVVGYVIFVIALGVTHL
jgi:hypothetical protein